ncbi:MAG: hypothetical protein K0R48_953 [Gammaproteobacteria bacterium]|jgi:uncharacterized protein (DUF2147 family)|nr:hypothetical protein [Gammaproteobacteria bacterium]
MKFSTRSIVFLLFVLFTALIQAALPSPEGRWTTIDDKSGKPKSVIQLSVSNGILNGVVVKVYKENAIDPNMTTCTKCSGPMKDKPILGLMVVQGLKAEADGSWSGGQVTDPETGKTYKCTITPSADGKTLGVRGYIGISLLGRTQTWVKAN